MILAFSPALNAPLARVTFHVARSQGSTGKIKFTVQDANSGKPLAGVKIVLQFSTTGVGSETLTTGKDGTVTTPDLSTGAWTFIATEAGFESSGKQVSVVADQVLEVPVPLTPDPEIIVRVTATRIALKAGDTSGGTVIKPSSKGGVTSNPQSLTALLKGSPSVAQDSSGQVHVRGEHAAISIYLDDVRLPDGFQGSLGQVVPPAAVQSFDFIDGGFAPRFGGATAAVLDVKLKAGQVKPFASFSADTGSFNTSDAAFSFGGEALGAYGPKPESGSQSKRLSYFFNFTARKTGLATEAPQPDLQSAHNGADNLTSFGNLSYRLSGSDTVSLLLGASPSHTQLANRTGLPSAYAPYGQGYGYLGQLSAAQAQLEGIVSQQQAGQDIVQYDSQEFAILGWKKELKGGGSAQLSATVSHEGSDVTNDNPAIDLNNLPVDNSIEFNPTVTRNAHSIDIQADVNWSRGPHGLEIGGATSDRNGFETYQLIPASQLALQGLQQTDPRLAPIGGVIPTLMVQRGGTYGDVYMQDTWKMSKKATLDYGLRYDYFQATSSALSSADSAGTAPTTSLVSQQFLSPRFNYSFLLNKSSVLRASYDKIFMTPPQAEGAILGQPIQPETLDQYDLSLEKQLGHGQSMKLALYYKNIRDQVDTGVLIPGTQIGIFTSVNFQTGSAHGVEFSYDIAPAHGVGWSGSVGLSNSIDRPGGNDNTGSPSPRFNDHDQLWNIGGNLGYDWKGGGSFALEIDYGSGLASSQIVDNGPRSPHTDVNVGLTAPKRWLKNRGVLSLGVENLFDERSLLNFASGFSGTRFQEGRRVTLSFSTDF